MLPIELTSHFKTVEKNVRIYEGVGDQHFNPYNAKLFLLTHDEMDTNSIAGGNEGTIYQYYKDNNTDSARIKYQVKWHEDAALTYTTIIDQDHGAENYAGFNDAKEENGGLYWLTSPHHLNCYNAQCANSDGDLSNHSICVFALGVAPAFCI